MASVAAAVVVNRINPRTYHHSKGCNMDTKYCQLHYNEYTHPATHDSAANRLSLDCYKADTDIGKHFCRSSAQRFPKALYDCLWNAQPDHNLVQQLHDGIRSFDLRGCQDGNDAVFCHGDHGERALGISFEHGFGQIGDFLQRFKREIITINLQVEDGDFDTVRQAFIVNVQHNLGDFLYVQEKPGVWPTLGEMVRSGKRVVVFGRWNEPAEAQTPPWLRTDDQQLIYRTWEFSQNINHSKQLHKAMMNFCAKPPADSLEKWQALEFSIPPSWDAVKTDVENGKMPEVCLKTFSDDEDTWMWKVSRFCYPKFKYFHRVMVDSYFESPVFKVVNWMNEMNLRRYVHEKKKKEVSRHPQHPPQHQHGHQGKGRRS